MKWVKGGTFRYGDDPYALLTKADQRGNKVYSISVEHNRVIIWFELGGQVNVYKTGAGVGTMRMSFDFYEQDNRKYLAITDLNPTLAGQTITNNRTGESIKVKTIATYHDSSTQVSGSGIVRYISSATIDDWYIEDDSDNS